MNIVKDRFKPIDKGKMYTYLVGLCWFTIILCWVLKLFGNKEFQMPEYTYNLNIWIEMLINLITYEINSVLGIMLLLKKKLNKKQLLITMLGSLVPYTMSLFVVTVYFKIIFEILLTLIIGFMYLKTKKYKVVIETIIVHSIIALFQIISMSYKFINISFVYSNLIVELMLMIDFYIIMILIILKNIKKGELIYDRWCRFLVVLSDRRSRKESISKNQSVIHKESVESEKGYKLFVVMLSVFQFTLVGFLCYFINNVTWQYIVVFISFVVMRLCFGKSYHCNSVISCTTLSCVTFISATRLGLPPHISVLCNVLNGCLLAYLMYVIYYFFKYTTAQAITIQKGMSKDLLLIVCKENNLTEFETNILIEYYCNRNKLLWIANKYGYSEDRLKAIKRNILERISK